MSITVGSRIGPYEVTSPLGRGGMGVVYRARDTKLNRDVALKFLPDQVAIDPDRLARFKREAEVLASLNHGKIASIYGLEESSNSLCIVMELVDGETVQERLHRGRIPLDETLAIARQIADALAAAHERGIVHRDLKPGNVMIARDGSVKVLDFGLAKALEPNVANSSLSQSPTLRDVTGSVVLGTPAYMSPEQAKGKPVDTRTDIFAFGGVLFEMLTGRPAFEGESAAEVLGRVVTAEPDMSRLPADTPPGVRRLLRRTLKKDPSQRLSDIRDARLEIDDVETDPEASIARKAPRSRVALVAIAALVMLTAIPAIRHWREAVPPAPLEMRLGIVTPQNQAPVDFALSPDGRYVVFRALDDSAQRLWLRPLDKPDAQPIGGTEAASGPFWSPDSRSIAFFVEGNLYRMDTAGGPKQLLAKAPTAGSGNVLYPGSGAWNAEGTILFTEVFGPIYRVPASGAQLPSAVTRPDSRTFHRFPRFLPDGRHFLFLRVTETENSIYLASLDGGEPKRLTASDTNAEYVHPDGVVYVRQGTLVAQRLNVMELTGEPVMLSDRIVYDPILGREAFSVSTSGTVAYRSRSPQSQDGPLLGSGQLDWVDRTGKVTNVIVESGLVAPELSPDDRRIAIARIAQDLNQDIWLMDVARRGFTRFTFDAARDNHPVWSPDGKQIAFQSIRTGQFNIYVRPTDMTRAEQPLLELPNRHTCPMDWSQDGRFLLYAEFNAAPTLTHDLFALPMTGPKRDSIVVANTPFDERAAQFSPDGSWVAYETNESGRREVVVQSFPEPVVKLPVSIDGGIYPRWRVDGKELYYVARDAKMMSAKVTTSGSTIQIDTPVALSPTTIEPPMLGSNQTAQYAISRDGRFLINQLGEELAVTTPITVLLNCKLKD